MFNVRQNFYTNTHDPSGALRHPPGPASTATTIPKGMFDPGPKDQVVVGLSTLVKILHFKMKTVPART